VIDKQAELLAKAQFVRVLPMGTSGAKALGYIALATIFMDSPATEKRRS